MVRCNETTCEEEKQVTQVYSKHGVNSNSDNGLTCNAPITSAESFPGYLILSTTHAVGTVTIQFLLVRK